MTTILQQLDDRFALDEMVPASEATSVAKMKRLLKRKHRIVLTHYNAPFMIGLEPDVYTALVRYVRNLEEKLEEAELQRMVDERLAKGIPQEQWLSEEDFYRRAMAAVRRTASPESGE